MTKKRLIKATIILLIIVEFFHYNSPVFEKYFLTNKLVEVSAEVEYKNPKLNIGYMYPPRYKLWELFKIKNEDAIPSPIQFPNQKSVTIKFELKGKEYHVRKVFKQHVHYISESVFEEYEKNKKGEFFVNPEAPEEDIFIYKPRPSDSEITRFFISVFISIFALLCFVKEKRTKNIAQIGLCVSLGAFMAFPANNQSHLTFMSYTFIYSTYNFILLKLFKKFRPSEKPPA